ncbi:hypothetical protein BpHYR1_006030 [Brachionus plicatilis]|uniref:Uncharacterized protein n=1 Tax=Brachionus plicatilis TaxID=10195 RepID=A0A3M7PYH8_BRAPC|nr:hypothetical protein BpHYR1_006030 [Brachionus plicatilis]
MIQSNKIVRSLKIDFKDLNGSTFSQLIDFDRSRNFSGNDSGTATKMKNKSKTAIAVARAITKFSEYEPSAGLVIKLAANVADTRPYAVVRFDSSVTSAT